MVFTILIVNELSVNGSVYRFALTNQLINQINTLKSLYASAYEDPEGFEEISFRISEVVSEIAESVEPPASDDDLDGIVQGIIKTTDRLNAEPTKRSRSKRKKKR